VLSGKSREEISMFNEFKKLLYLPLIIVICSFLMICPAQAADEPPAVGDSLPPIKLAVPDDPQAKSHLGLSGSGQFTVPQIEAQVVIIEIFNMY
jgi:hypothetical protein